MYYCKNNHKQLKTSELQKYKFSHLGTWPIFVWELGKKLFGELAKFSKHKRIMRHSIKLLYFCLLKKIIFMIKENLNKIRATLPEGVTLVAVSKTKPVSDLQEAYDAGQRVFGENHALEMRDKHEALPQDIQWHFIGHLQTNKIKYIIPFVTLIHSIDSANLLEAVNKEAKKHDRVVDCLLQFHIAQEETKFGLDLEEARQLLDSEAFKQMENVRICGVMGMATFTDDEDEVRKEFKHLKAIFDTLKHDYFVNQPQFKEISMGMSDDYPIAVEEGATMVRVGSKIFGARFYNVR